MSGFWGGLPATWFAPRPFPLCDAMRVWQDAQDLNKRLGEPHPRPRSTLHPHPSRHSHIEAEIPVFEESAHLIVCFVDIQ